MANIQNLTESWENHTGTEVEAFIKKTFGERVGCIRIAQNENQTDNVIIGFKDEDDYDTWNALSDSDKWGETGQALMVTYATIPSAEGSDTYTVTLSLRENPSTIQPTNDVTLNVKGASSVIYAAGGTELITEDLVLQIQTRTSPSASWISRGEIVITANDANYTAVSLKDYLYAGTNYVRIRAVGEYASSVWRSFTLNVVNLTLTPNTAFELPLTGSTLELNYLVGGSVAKTLQFEIGTGHGTSFVAQYSYLNGDAGCSRNLGTSTNMSTGMTFEFDDATMLATIMANGVHTVRARLYVSEAVHTDWVESQYMVARNTQTPYVVVNDVRNNLANWTEVKFFDWAAFTGGAASMGVTFRLTDEENEDTYASWSFTAENNTLYSFAVQLGIELANSALTEFYGYMHIEDENGNEIASPIFFQFTNSADNQPTAGADLVIQPSGRSNGEANPARIINTVDGSVIPSTFTGFGFTSDGWVDVNKDVDSTSANAEKIRALHIPAGRSLDINYNPFSQLTDGNNTGRSMTLEIDFRTNNILNEEEPILRIGGDASDGEIWGFEMLPLEARMLTQRMRAIDDQNVSWAEGVRTHLAVNVVYGLQGLNYVRIFLNGIIEREFNYVSSDRFTEPNVHIVLGNTSSDIDIFGIRCYKKALSTTEVMQDYKANMSSVAEKVDFAGKNDILGDGGEISYTKVLGKYNLIAHTGHLPKYGDENKGKTTGVSIYINIVGDPAHSGTLDNLESSGQGTTAMTYRDWNQQYKITDNSVFTPDEGEASEAGAGYAIQQGEYLAKKLVGKINFASGMQSHKLGLTWIYNDLFKRLIQNGVITRPAQMELYPNARITVFEKPFLFFHRETPSDPWTFKYLMTFGAGKADKPTFGFNKSTTPNLLMLEGANNDRPLALFRIPWNDDITYSPDDEAYMYNGQKQLNFGVGTTTKVDGKEYPSSTSAINAHKAFFNFAYLHHSRVTFFNGTLSELKRSEAVSTSRLYWVTQDDVSIGSYRYDLYRYDEITSQWVDAGVSKISAGNYEKLNLRTQYETFCSEAGATAQSWTVGQWAATNDIIIGMRRTHFKAKASLYIHVDDALYHSCFVKFFAGTDNRAKNTYYATDPTTLKMRFWQDDLDTMIKTNNVGQNRKPYYVEEHDINDAGDFYWQGEESGFYNVLEEAFETEMTTMMNNMMTGMAQLSGSVMQFIEHYFLSTQDYFPAIAYNEQARLVYEAAAVAQAAGTYKNDSVQAITQSCGSQRWSEYQWLKDRIMYISSWCEYGEFAGSSTASGGMSWRGKNGATYNFKLTPAKWLYPRVGSDSGNYPASAGGKRVRVPAGQQLIYPAITLSSDSWISVRGIDYMLDIGDMNIGLSSEQGTFSLSGKRLQRIAINELGTDVNQFLATSIVISNATNIKELIVRQVATVSGAFDLSKCNRLEEIDLRGTTFSIVELPASENLETVKMPSTLTELVVKDQPNLETLTIGGASYLTAVEIDQARAGSLDTGALMTSIYLEKQNGGAAITSVKLSGISWTGIRADMLMYYATATISEMSGSIALLAAANDRYLTFAEVVSLIDKFGNIQSQSSDLYIDYPKRSINTFAIKGIKYIHTLGEFRGWVLQMQPTAGNNIAIENGHEAVSWAFSGDNASVAAQYASITNNIKGYLNVIRLSDPAIDLRFTVTVTIKLTDGTIMTMDKKVGFYNRIPKVGDFAYVDGSFDDEYDKSKTLAGAVVKKEKVSDSQYKLWVYAKENAVVKSTDGTINTAGLPWGIYPEAAGTNGFPTSVTDEIKNDAELTSAVDTAMANIGSHGMSTAYIPTSDYADPNQEDGFKVYGSGVAAGDFDTENKNNIVINHANAIINGHLEESYPRTITELADAMAALVAAKTAAGVTSPNRYRQLYFPATYACRLYEPTVEEGEDLDNQYKSGKWMLPAAGLLCRIYNFFYRSCGSVTYANGGRCTAANANEAPESEALMPLFANLLARIARVPQAGTPFAIPDGNSGYWSVTEGNSYTAWFVYFSNGYVSYTSKCNGLVVRPVVAFTFNL